MKIPTVNVLNAKKKKDFYNLQQNILNSKAITKPRPK